MTSNKNLITASLATFLLVSGVQGQTDLTLLACDPAATGAERGSKLTTCKSTNMVYFQLHPKITELTDTIAFSLFCFYCVCCIEKTK